MAEPTVQSETRHSCARNLPSGILLGLFATTLLSACGGGGGDSSSGGGTVTPPPPPPVVSGPAWLGFGRNAQHTALGDTSAQGAPGAFALGHIIWETPVDLAPPAGVTAIHYGSPMITAKNTVVVPVKTTATGGFRVEARSASNGSLLWNAVSDYLMPPLVAHEWIPSFGASITSAGRLYMPGKGGKLWYRDQVDSNTGTLQNTVFYGQANYAAASGTYDNNVYIVTPVTTDAAGNAYFGFNVTGATPAGLISGVARIGADGSAKWIAAKDIIGTASAIDMALNAAPAVSADGKTLYVAGHTPLGAPARQGYLMAVDASTLQPIRAVALMDPNTGLAATVSDESTASPMVAPDGDVFYGVLETSIGDHNDRGWLLHFDASLAILKTPGSFGWDNTPSIVPASLVTQYLGGSSYLILSKYNNYADFSTGDGKNKMAILDPNAVEPDPVLGNPVMKEVITVLGQTSDTADHPTQPGAVKEWCINTGAVDPVTRSVFFNSEDGFLYRWDLTTGLISQRIWLDNGYGQAYTPTALGPDGTIYSINNGALFAVRN